MDELAKLKTYVRPLPRGRVQAVKEVESLLAACWHLLEGSDESPSSRSAMRGYKLRGRIEELSWGAPHLTFKIERRGAVVKGNKISEMYFWQINVEEGTARGGFLRNRNLEPVEKL